MLDDNASELAQLREVCGRLGLSVRLVSSAEEARQAALGSRPLATMVGLSTVEVTEAGVRQLKAVKELAQVPVVAFGQATLDEIRRTFVAGADDHLGRPLDATWLGAKLVVLRDAARLPPVRAPEKMARTVLVADDDLFFRQRTRDVLESAGYRVTEAASGLEVMKLLDDPKAERPDLVVIDVFMPGLGGLELVRAMRATQAWAAVPIVVVSGMRNDPALRKELFRLGVLDFIDKYAVTIDGVQPIVDEYLQPGGSKRRSSPRASHFALCEYRRQPNEDWQLGFVYNLSAAGVFIRTLTPPALGAMVDARMDLGPAAPKVLTKARVAWVNELRADAGGQPLGMGLSFGELPDDARARIAQIVGA
jgi:CheY-like chemotaxis protein/Tfp pilus assembly protein PilZ